jgi:hypothetical protein
MSQFEIHKQNEIRKQEIEVKALVALAEFGLGGEKFRALSKLKDIAFPEELAEKINQGIQDKHIQKQEKII